MKAWGLGVVMSLLSLGCSVPSGGNSQIKVLITDGFSNHDWKHTTECIQSILEQSPEMTVSVSTYSSEGAREWNPQFSKYDVIVQTCNDIKSGTQWPRGVQEALESYVEQGGGLFVFHSANNAFPQWVEYNRMIGLGWRQKDFGWAVTLDEHGQTSRIPAGEGEKTSHGKRVDALLTRIGEHPVHAGLPRQWMAADIEIYRYARGPAENLTVLSYANDQKTGLNFPTEWTVTYGKGRVYNSTFGHVWHNQTEPEGIRCVGFQTLMPRVVQWLAGREVDASVPEDFPTTVAGSLRSGSVGK